MTREHEELKRERRLVVVSDICSSTTILEDLKRTDNLDVWRNFLIGLKDCLLREGGKFGMELYKFIGDGWILLFPSTVSKKELCTFLTVLSTAFDAQFEASISPLLSKQPSPVGLTFGIDTGELICLEMNEQVEYLGRAINVASRLQSCAKEHAGGPSYKALFSRNSFNSLGESPANEQVELITVTLRNISPSEIECFVFKTYENPERIPRKTGPDTMVKPASPEHTPVARAKNNAPNIIVTGALCVRVAPLGPLGQWILSTHGQEGLVLQFTNEAKNDGSPNVGAIVKALLIYRVDGKEATRVTGTWLDEFDLPTFRVDDTHSLVVCIGSPSEFCALGTSRKATGPGSDGIESRPSRFWPIPPKISVLVRLTDANKGDFLYEREFVVRTNPLKFESGT